MALNDEREAKRDLPAAYRSPFRALGDDLRAVLATIRLGGQQLWRRNRQGDLPLPSFWPSRLGALFWPLLLAMALVCLTVLPIGWRRLGPHRAASPPSRPTASQPATHPASQPASQSASTADTAETPEPEPQAPPSEVSSREQAPVPEPASLELDPLLALIVQQDPMHLIARVHPEPASSRLELELSEAFRDLPDNQRSVEAERWLERSLELGYEQLELVDEAGRLLGRQARVGSGMILLNSSDLS